MNYTNNKKKQVLGQILGGILIILALIVPINRVLAYSHSDLTFFKGLYFDTSLVSNSWPFNVNDNQLVSASVYNENYYQFYLDFITDPKPGQITLWFKTETGYGPLTFPINCYISFTPYNSNGQAGIMVNEDLEQVTETFTDNNYKPVTFAIPDYVLPSGYTHYRVNFMIYSGYSIDDNPQPPQHLFTAKIYGPGYNPGPLEMMTSNGYSYNGFVNNYGTPWYFEFSDLVPVINVTSPLNGSLISNGQPINLIGYIDDYADKWANYNALDLTLTDKISGAQYQYFTNIDSPYGVHGNFNFVLSNLPSNTPGTNPGYTFTFQLDNTIQGTNLINKITPDYILNVSTYIPANPFNSSSPYANYTKDDPGVWWGTHYPSIDEPNDFSTMTAFIGPALESTNQWFSAFSANFDATKAETAGLNIANGFKITFAYVQNINDVFPVECIITSTLTYIGFELAMISGKAILATIKTIKP